MLQRPLQRRDVVVRDHIEARGVRSESFAAVRVRAGADDGDGAPVEIAFAHDDAGLVARDALALVAPFAGQLQRGLHGLGAGVHRKHLVVFEIAGDVFLELAEHVVVESTAGERELLRLRGECLDDLRMAVPLVHRAVGAEEVVVALAFHVPEEDALSPFQHHGQRVVVVRAEAVLKADGTLAAGLVMLGSRHGVQDLLNAPQRYGFREGRANATCPRKR